MRIPIISNFFKGNSPEILLALDLGTHSIKTLFFTPDPKTQKFETHGKSEQKQGLSSMTGGHIADLDAVLEVISLALEETSLATSLKPKSVILGTSGGIVESIGMTVRFKRPQPETEVLSKELDLLLKKIQEKTLPKAKERLIGKNEPELVETLITTYRLDNKKVTSPLGLAGATLEICLLHNFCLKSDLNSLQTITKELGLHLIFLGGTSTITAHTLLPKHEAGILIDMGGQTTEVILFKNGKIIANKFFHWGGQHLTYALAERLNLSFDQAEKTKLDLTSGVLDSGRAHEAREILANALSVWVQGIEIALGEFKNVKPLPALFVVTGGGSTPEEVKAALITHPWNKLLPFSSFPKIEHLKMTSTLALAQNYSEQH